MRLLIVPSKVDDVYRIAANLRTKDAEEITGFGITPRAALRLSFRNAILRRTAFIDGEIAAMWGLGGAMLDESGVPWLMTTPIVERVPVTVLKVARAQLDDMLALRRQLSNYVLASYTGACRLLEVLGFVLEPAQPMGPHGVLYRRFWIGK